MKTFRRQAPSQIKIMALLQKIYPMPLPTEMIALETGIDHHHLGNLLHQMRLSGRILRLTEKGSGGFARAALWGAFPKRKI